MQKTLIEWVRNPDGSQGATINPTPGCSMEGCALGKKCYALKGAPRQRKNCKDCGDFKPHVHYERFVAMASRKIPTGYFFSTGEFFDKVFTNREIQGRLNYLGNQCEQHRIYILTKQPLRLPIFNYPPNVWLGVSVNRVEDIWRIDMLRRTNAKIKFVSFEPLYENVGDDFDLNLDGINWIIIGGETQYGKITFNPASFWVLGLLDAARCHGSAVFMKNNIDIIKLHIQEFPVWIIGEKGVK